LSERTIILAENEVEVANFLEMALRFEGYDVRVVREGDFLDAVFESNGQLAAVMLDIPNPRQSLELLRRLRGARPRLPIIVYSGTASPEAVVEAMRNGASDFLAKPLTHDRLMRAIRSATEVAAPPRDSRPAHAGIEPFFSSNPRMRAIQTAIQQIALSDVPVVLRGESGVGKEVLAREIHARSPRAHKPLLKINCAAVPLELLESELFGYERGAFTGAMRTTPGKFEVADGGMILLDEIGDMDFKLQAKLLHVLQDNEFQRLGGRETIRVNVRILAATHCDLERALQEGRFREDLYYRLNVISLSIPPLRDRRDEILPLARLFLEKHALPGMTPPAPTQRLNEALLAYHWPGNIRELENTIRKYLVFGDPDALAEELWQKVSVASAGPQMVGQRKTGARCRISALDEVERARNQEEAKTILDTLNQTHWNRRRAAEILNIDYKGLLYRMKKLRIGGPHPAAAGNQAVRRA
jgi:DNA-binding NtrC family response regulator